MSPSRRLYDIGACDSDSDFGESAVEELPAELIQAWMQEGKKHEKHTTKRKGRSDKGKKRKHSGL
jgi:hypothetical protein